MLIVFFLMLLPQRSLKHVVRTNHTDMPRVSNRKGEKL
ncbi:MAG: hypothetical protein OJF49_003991 [Ktedonobacterales bacterium]|nr:MAG: hypothetical protein OJF49_003991 [Ktedonobacterales bacterium]